MNLADFGLEKWKNDPKFVRDSNSSLKLLTFKLSNVRELETIKYAFDAFYISSGANLPRQLTKTMTRQVFTVMSLWPRELMGFFFTLEWTLICSKASP